LVLGTLIKYYFQYNVRGIGLLFGFVLPAAILVLPFVLIIDICKNPNFTLFIKIDAIITSLIIVLYYPIIIAISAARLNPDCYEIDWDNLASSTSPFAFSVKRLLAYATAVL
jgi:hypothetical protein